MMMPSVADVLAGLGAEKHLDRERALRSFEQLLGDAGDPECLADVEGGVKQLLASSEWQRRLGGLMAARVLVDRAARSAECSAECSASSGAAGPQGFDALLMAECLRLLEDGEVRVRLAVGQLLRSLVVAHGPAVYEEAAPEVLRSIHEHFDREGEGRRADDSAFASGSASPGGGGSPQPGSPSSTGGSGFRPGSPNLLAMLLESSYRPLAPGVGQMRHGSEGWKCLETSVKALQQLLEGAGAPLAPLVDEEVVELLLRSVHHPNRFVRETAHFTLASLSHVLAGPRLLGLGQQLAGCLADGMSDSWSQVRYAACVATREFMCCLGPDQQQHFLPSLTGPMCLNRYYVAEGVRLFAQDTWRQVMGDSGRDMVARHISQVVFYYISQSKASNHAVREAACAVIAELMAKVDRHAVAPHVPDLLRALLLCFKDSSWPVRDAACSACGRCVLTYPEESSEVLEQLYALWLEHLWDNIPSVREGSAAALGQAMRAYGDDAVRRVVEALRMLLPQAHSQPAESQRYSDLENTSTFGVAARRARDNDPAVHSNQDMFSCGSLAARFSTSRLVRSDGCNDFGFARAKEPWEASDGAVHMVRELAALAPGAAAEFLPALAELARLASFQHAYNLHETIWRCLPAIAASIGVREFKAAHLDAFLPSLFDDLRCGHQLAAAEAGKCISALRDMVGPRIFAGRLDDAQRAALAGNENILAPKAAGAAARPAAVVRGSAAAGVTSGVVAPQAVKQAWG